MMLSPMLLYSIFCILIDLFYNKQQIGKHLNRLFLFRNVGQGQFFIHSTSYIIKLGVICPLYCPSRVQSVNSNSWALRHRPSIQSYQSSKRPPLPQDNFTNRPSLSIYYVFQIYSCKLNCRKWRAKELYGSAGLSSTWTRSSWCSRWGPVERTTLSQSRWDHFWLFVSTKVKNFALGHLRKFNSGQMLLKLSNKVGDFSIIFLFQFFNTLL